MKRQYWKLKKWAKSRIRTLKWSKNSRGGQYSSGYNSYGVALRLVLQDPGFTIVTETNLPSKSWTANHQEICLFDPLQFASRITLQVCDGKGKWYEYKRKSIWLLLSLYILIFSLYNSSIVTQLAYICIQYKRNKKMIQVQIIRVEKELASQVSTGRSTYSTIHVLFVFDSILVSHHNSLHPNSKVPNTTSICWY